MECIHEMLWCSGSGYGGLKVFLQPSGSVRLFGVGVDILLVEVYVVSYLALGFKIWYICLLGHIINSEMPYKLAN